MNTERTEKFVNAIACDLEEGGFRQVSGTTLRRTLATAVSAALPLLADTGIPTWQPAELAEQQGVELVELAMVEKAMLAHAGKHVTRYAIAELRALAATGKQQVGEVLIQRPVAPHAANNAPSPTIRMQVGEVQGDAREQFEAWAQEQGLAVERNKLDDDYLFGETYDAWATWQAALAARQPGAQEQPSFGQVREIRIPARNKLDPISVFVQDQAAGRGRIVITCYGNAWQGFWNAMGDRTVMQFVAKCDPDYVAGSMLQGRQTRIAKHDRDYATRIAAEVIAEFRTLIDGQRDAAPGVGNG